MRLEVKNVTKNFGQLSAVDDVSFTIDDEVQVLALIGPSGGGKSTLLRLIGGLEIPTSGSVVFDGDPLQLDERSLRRHRRQNGFLFQSYNLFPHLTVLQNVALPLEKVHGSTALDAKETAVNALERFGLADHMQKHPAQLSGGQQQRVGLARAIAHQPRLLILDEPTSALDPEMTAEVLEFVDGLRKEGQRIVLSTHEMGFARQAADRVLFLADGKLVESGNADSIFANPESEQVKRFLSRVMKW